MNSLDTTTAPELTAEELNLLIIDCAQDIKAKNITLIDLRKLDTRPTDFFVICEGESSTQVKAIAANVQRRLRTEQGIRPSLTEGTDHSRWVLSDYFSVILHVFHPETREFYDLEDLWSDAEFTTYQDI